MWALLPAVLALLALFYAPSVLIWIGDEVLPALLRLLRRDDRVDVLPREPELP